MKKLNPDPVKSLNRRGSHENPDQKQVASDLQREEPRRLNLNIPASLHKELKMHSVSVERDMSSIVIDVVRAYLDEHSNE